MGRLWLFLLISWFTHNPVLALIVVLLVSASSYGYLTGRVFGIGRLLNDWRAIRMLRRTVSTNPNDLTARAELGHRLCRTGQDAEAIAALLPVVEREPGLAEPRADLGLALLRSGRGEDGEGHLREALAIDPRLRYGEPLLRWADLLTRQGDHPRGVRLLEEHREFHSSSVEGLYKLGRAYLRTGDPARAREALEAALVAYRTSPRFKRRLERRWWLASHLLRWRAG